jgi:hypothetical protein
MTNADERIATALQHDAPPPRDPVFRLQVIERRERKQFGRRVLQGCAAVSAIGGISAFTANAGGHGYIVGSVLLFALVLIMAAVVYLPVFGRLIRQLR